MTLPSELATANILPSGRNATDLTLLFLLGAWRCFSGRHVPELDRVVVTPRSEGPAIWAKRNGFNVTLVPCEYRYIFARGHIPQVNGADFKNSPTSTHRTPFPIAAAIVLPSGLNAADRAMSSDSFLSVAIFLPVDTSQSMIG